MNRTGRAIEQVALCACVGVAAYLSASLAATRMHNSHHGLLCEQPNYQFGKVPPGTKVQAEFHFKNFGSSAETFASAKTSCSCSVVDLPKDPIDPGKSVTVKAGLNTASRFGPILESIVLTTISGTSMPLTIQGNVFPNWAPERKRVDFIVGGSQHSSKETDSQTFLLQAWNLPAQKQLTVKQDLPDWLRVGVTGAGENSFNISVEVALAPTVGVVKHDVTLLFPETKYPAYVFRVNVKRPGAPFVVNPPRLFVPTLDDGTTTKRTISVAPENSQQIEPKKLSRVWITPESKDPVVMCSLLPNQTGSKQSVVEVSIDNSKAAGITTRCVLNIEYDGNQTLSVPISCFGKAR